MPRRRFSARRARRGFTLTELLVAMGLGLIVLGVVGYAYFNTNKAIRRSLAMVALHQQAAAVFQRMESQAFAATAGMRTPASPTNTLQFTYARPAVDDDENATDSPSDNLAGFCSATAKWSFVSDGTFDDGEQRYRLDVTEEVATAAADLFASPTSQSATPTVLLEDVEVANISGSNQPFFAISGDFVVVRFRLRSNSSSDYLGQTYEHWIPTIKSSLE